MRAVILIRQGMSDRREMFAEGLRSLGYSIANGGSPRPGDVLVTWNRYGPSDCAARQYEAAGASVIVAENGYMGKAWKGSAWFALSLGQHNGAGRWTVGGPKRWDSLGVELAPWRTGGDEVVVLPQRGIGPRGVAMPRDWPAARYGRVRPHPGLRACVPLEDDLARARCVVTWGSGAALKALAMGIPVFHAMPQWIGAPAALPLDRLGCEPKRDDADRLAMFRRLAWAMWRDSEIETGDAFRWLMRSSGDS